MPDFDQFERKLRKVIVEISREARPISKNAYSKCAECLCIEPEINRPLLFKGKSSADLEGYLSRVDMFFTSQFPSGYRFITSPDNPIGKDLTEIKSGTEIEIKTGTAKTDANLGVSTVAYILSADPSETEYIRMVLKNGINARRANHRDAEFVKNSKKSTSIALKQWLDKCITNIASDPKKKAHIIEMLSKISKGITKLPDLKLPNPPEILLLECDWDSGFKYYQYDVSANGMLSNVTVFCTEKNRVGLYATIDGVSFKLYLHYRNSYHGKGGMIIPADAWVSTASFQCWIGR